MRHKINSNSWATRGTDNKAPEELEPCLRPSRFLQNHARFTPPSETNTITFRALNNVIIFPSHTS